MFTSCERTVSIPTNSNGQNTHAKLFLMFINGKERKWNNNEFG